MIRPITEKNITSRLRYIEFSGKHNDTKPTYNYLVTGSLFLEVDTGDVYAYEEEGKTWTKIISLGGG